MSTFLSQRSPRSWPTTTRGSPDGTLAQTGPLSAMTTYKLGPEERNALA